MPRYIRSIKYNEDYPDIPLVGHAIVYVPDIPEELAEEMALQRLENEINNLASRAGEVFHSELVAKTYARKGSLLTDIFFNCDLPTLLSTKNLKQLGVYIPDEVIYGMQAGTVAYTTALTFKAIRRLERGMSKICMMLKNYIMVRASAASRIISKEGKDNSLSEARSGMLGLLSKLYDAVSVCASSSPIKKRRDAIIRVRNTINTFDDVITAKEDRAFLCTLLKPLIEQIPDIEHSEIGRNKEDAPNADEYAGYKKQIDSRLGYICQSSVAKAKKAK